MSLSLLVLAAGMGSRYGGLKQLEPVGPAGETLLDYAVHAAHAAGFTRVVFVIRQNFEEAFRATVGRRYEGALMVDYVFQAADAIPPGRKIPEGRTKPWGTGHAVWCARAALHENFAAINADDFYGAQAFALLADFLRGPGQIASNRFAMIGFKLGQTLSEHGTVSRGICRVGENGELAGIVEEPRISPSEVGPGRKFSGQEIVSMNCWGLTEAVFPLLDRAWEKFWETLTPENALRAEFYLPTAIGAAVSDGTATVRVLPSDEAWFGLTYPDDKPRVREALRDLGRAGKFPPKLF